MAVAAVSSWVPEGVLHDIMDDGCLLRNYSDFRDSLLLYVCFVDSVSQFTWPRLAAPIGGEATTGMLGSAAVRAVHVCSAFKVVRFIGDMRQMPWALCIGDIDSNLICLTAREGEISNLVACRIRP